MKEGPPVSQSDEEVVDFWVTVWPELVEAVEQGTLEPEDEFLPKESTHLEEI